MRVLECLAEWDSTSLIAVKREATSVTFEVRSSPIDNLLKSDFSQRE